MMKKIEHLTRELQEFFPEKSSVEIVKKLGDLTQIQENFSASKSFKKQLKSRLENIHAVEHNTPFSFTSLFRYTTVFASFLFVSGASYMYYTIQQENLHEGIEMHLQDEVSQASMGGDISTQSMDIETPKEISSLETSPQPDQTSSSVELNSRVNHDVSTQKVTGENETPVSSENASIRSVSEPENSQDEASVMKISESKLHDTLPHTEEIQVKHDQGNDEFIITEIFDMFETPSPENEMTPPASDMLPPGDMIEKGMNSIIPPLSDPFIDICFSYSGSLSDDREKCFFGPQQFCTRENIFLKSEIRCEYLPVILEEK